MATTKQQPKGKPAAAAATVQPKVKAPVLNLPFLFDRENYMIMIAGMVIVIIGFLLMTGPGNDNPAVFPREEIYSFRRITLAPIIVILGFLVEVYAILKRPKTA